MDRSAVILASDSSAKFSGDKGLLDLHGKPLINHVIDAVKGLVDEIIVVTGSQQCADLYEKVVSSDVKFVVDDYESKGLLAGVIAGFEASQSEYSALLPFDSPLFPKKSCHCSLTAPLEKPQLFQGQPTWYVNPYTLFTIPNKRCKQLKRRWLITKLTCNRWWINCGAYVTCL